jgi:hypothetical protein
MAVHRTFLIGLSVPCGCAHAYGTSQSRPQAQMPGLRAGSTAPKRSAHETGHVVRDEPALQSQFLT